MQAPISHSPSSVAPTWWAVAFCVAVVTTVVVAITLGHPETPSDHWADDVRWAATTTAANARSTLAGLDIVETSPEVAYDRTRDFGQAWVDVDHNGCDTRNDILGRDLTDVRFSADRPTCIVVQGRLVDPYSGELISFSRSSPSQVQIDHLIPLHAAWMLGAWRWDPGQRLAFANDPRNLVSVDGGQNQTKSDSLVDRWKPPNRRVHCIYAINTIAVHDAYRLGVTQTEKQELKRLLHTCP